MGEHRVRFAEPAITAAEIPGGGVVLRSREELRPHAVHVGEWLVKWGEKAPDRVFVAERTASAAGLGPWRRVTYAEALAATEAIGQALLERDLGPERPVVILSDNGVDFALLSLGAMRAGVPVAPVSPAYSLMSKDFVKLRYIFDLVRPGLVYAIDGRRFEPALRAIDLGGAEIAVSGNPPESLRATPFGDLVATRPGEAIKAARITPDTVAKILFTSGSTGEPKGVINTQRMLCSSQQALAQVWPFLDDEGRPPILVDWLPWNHTFGGNHNFNMVLRSGGTLYIDSGKPAPGLIDITAVNYREISPTLVFNVPRGYDMLLPFLERDKELRDSFFRDLDLVHYAAAALPKHLWERLEKVSIEARGERVPMVSAWGSTETSPLATAVHFFIPGPGNIGVPVPGTEIKMVPSGDKLELRVRGPNVTPGYWKRPDLTAAAFDEDQFVKMGDAGKLAEPGAPSKGLVFDGRTSEDFKLSSGTWVHVGALRVAAVAAGAPVVQDMVLTGHDRDFIGALIFPSLAGCRSLCPEAGPDASLDDLIRRPAVRDHLAAALRAHNAAAPASSTRIQRALLLAEPPSIDAGEITDKGYINQRAVLTRRAPLVEALTAGSDPEILVLDRLS
jgi:feruloyl-CoA synthase